MNKFYLDEDILVNHNFNGDVYNNLTGEYRIYELERLQSGSHYRSDYIFYGRLFVPAFSTGVTIYLNDIIASQYIPDNGIVAKNNTLSESHNRCENIYNKYKIEVTFNESLWNFEEEIQVYNTNRYPTLDVATGYNHNKYGGDGLEDINDESKAMLLLREGFNTETQESTLLPHVAPMMYFGYLSYPMGKYITDVTNSNILYFISGDNKTMRNIYLGYYNIPVPQYTFRLIPNAGSMFKPDDIYLATNCTIYGDTGYERILAEAMGEDTDEQEANLFLQNVLGIEAFKAREMVDDIERGITTEIWTGKTEDAANILMQASRYFDCVREDIEGEITKYIKVAKVDECPAKYYLLWYDRMGGIQSQGFDGKNIFSDDYKRTLVKNTYKHQRVGNMTIQPKWKLSTGFITDDEYKVYESLFVSHYVTLYDTENNKYFNVLVTDTNYAEKTYKNQNEKLVSFSIELELSKEQRIFN